MTRAFPKRLLQCATVAAALGLAVSAQAHRAWLLPSSTVLSGENPWVTVDAAVSNDLFYFEHVPLRLQGIGAAAADSRGGAPLQVLAPDGSEVQPQNGAVGRFRSTFDLHLTQSGTYKLVSSREGLFARYTEQGETKRWRGTAESFAREVPKNATDLEVTQSDTRMEVFITTGNPSDAFKPTGKGLELNPTTHPNDLFAGETAEFQFLLDGKPANNVTVTVIRGGKRYRDQLEEIELKSDNQGHITITWPQPGMYWLEAEVSTDQGVSPPATQRRASYSATLEVLPE